MPHADYADCADKKDECLSQITLISQIKNDWDKDQKKDLT